jgi:hypothetical protein
VTGFCRRAIFLNVSTIETNDRSSAMPGFSQFDIPEIPHDILKRLDPRRQIRERDRFIRFWLPCTVRVLIVTDGSDFTMGGGFSLGRVIQAITTNLPHFVTVNVTTAFHHSAPGSGADENSLDFSAHNLAQYDAIWFFAVARGSAAYNPGELTAIWNFMQGGGGVFATGDHENLGEALCGGIPRVRSMRRWFWPGTGPNGEPAAPGSFGDNLETTVGNDFDQSPQVIKPRMYGLGGRPWFWPRVRPHPVLCGPNGPVRVLPDHMHEGVCEVPSNLSATMSVDGNSVSEYPHRGGSPHSPEVIAHATDHNGGADFGVIAAYDGHLVDSINGGVGRVLVDATWHHYFGMNVDQFADGYDIVQANIAASIVPTAQNLARAAHWEQISAYFRNTAVWLARRPTQDCIRNRGIWLIAQHVDVLMAFHQDLKIHPDVLGYYLDIGRKARDVFNRIAPQCSLDVLLYEIAINSNLRAALNPWILQASDKEEKQRLGIHSADTLTSIMLGGAIHEVAGMGKFDEKFVGSKKYMDRVSKGAAGALAIYAGRLMEDAKFLSRMADSSDKQ